MNRKPLHMQTVLFGGLVLSLGALSPFVGDAFRSATTAPAKLAPVVPPPIAINPDDWKSLASAVRKQARRFGGSSGYIIKDLRSGDTVVSNEAQVFPSASLIKFPILCAAFQAAQEGKFSLTLPITVQKGDRRGGSGVLKNMPVNSVFTNRELLELMIIHSDNTAAQLIVRQLGFEYLQSTFSRLGLIDTRITPEGFQLTSSQVAEDNLTSPRDMALLLEKIYKRQLVSPEASDQMLDILRHQKLRDRLPRFLPTGWEIAHKTGLIRKACHDVGIVFSPRGDYMICVLTDHDVTYKTAKGFIASVGRITFNYYGGVHHAMMPVRMSDGQARLPDSRRSASSAEPA